MGICGQVINKYLIEGNIYKRDRKLYELEIYQVTINILEDSQLNPMELEKEIAFFKSKIKDCKKQIKEYNIEIEQLKKGD